MIEKDEPMSLAQISCQFTATKKECEEALDMMINDGRVRRKEV
jgi:hypothetical protein